MMKQFKTKNLLTGFSIIFMLAGAIYFLSNKEADQKKGNVENEEEGIPLRDRMDLAWQQEVELTKDPATNSVPKERLLIAYRELQERIAHSPNGRITGAIPGMNWVERGPDNVGGRTRAILVDPNDLTKRKVWAGGVGGGLWFTNDITQANPVWIKVDDFFSNICISSIVFNPLNSLEMYFGTGEGWYNADAQRGLGIWKSTNGGATWNQLASTNNANFYYVNRMTVHPVSGDIYAATRNGLYRSQNGGTTWTQVLGNGNGSTSNTITDVEIAADNSVYAAAGNFLGGDGVYRSLSGNAGSYSKLNSGANGFPTAGIARIELTCALSAPATVYAMVENSANNRLLNIYKTTNSGTTWTTCTLPTWVDQACGTPNNDITRTQAWYDLTIAVDPNNANSVYAGGVDLVKSSDGGTTWAQISSWWGGCGFQEVHADQHWIYFEPGSSSVIYFGNDGGVWRTTNGTAAIPSIAGKNSGYNVTQFYGCAMYPALGSNYFLAGAQDNGSHQFSIPGINSTIEVTGGDGCFTHIDQDQPQYQWTSYVYNNFFRSANCGQSWTSVGFSGGSFVNPSDYDNSANIMYSANAGGQYRRWTNPQSGNTSATVNLSGGESGTITHIVVSENTTNRIYIGLNNGRVYRVDNANTVASGSAGTLISGGALPNGSISCIAIENGNDNHLLVTLSNYGVNSIWETTNGGGSWVSVEGNLPDFPVRWALFNPSNNTQAVIATELGVWSTDLLSGGATVWGQSSTGLANTRVDMLQIRASDNLIVAATHGRGLFTSDVFCAPYADFKSNESISYIGANIFFNDASQKATAWLWDFGDGFTSILQNPSHAYTSPGTYNVSLTINGTVARLKNNFIQILPNRGTPYTLAMGGNFDVNPGDFGAPVAMPATACGTVTNFERGNSAIAGKNGTRSGSFAWVTGLTQANYVNNAAAFLYSPNYNFSAGGVYTLRFYRKTDFEIGYDGLIVEYSINRGISWTPFGTVAANWYDYSTGGTTAFPPGQPFFNALQAAYTLSQYDVSFLSGNSSVSFRITFKSDISATDVGAAIDDFEILAPVNSPLPVELLSFEGKNENNINVLTWSTASETNNSGFEIQRSDNGTEFYKIGFVKGAGTTSQLNSYSFNDKNLVKSVYYYRLKQTDFSGNFRYSNKIAIRTKISSASVLFIYPNPFSDAINILFDEKAEGVARFVLADAKGSILLDEQKTIMPGSIRIQIPGEQASSGIYFLAIETAGSRSTHKLFRK